MEDNRKRYTVQARPYVFTMAVATLCYLVVELAFNARLLDVTGSLNDEATLDSIEKWGRVISGIALALIGWSIVLPRMLRPKHIVEKTKIQNDIFSVLMVLLLTTTVSVTTAWFGEKLLIDKIVDSTSGQTRKSFTLLAFYRDSILQGFIKQTDVDQQALDSPAMKAVIALLPVLKFPSMQDGKSLDSMSALVMIPAVLEKEIAKVIGTSDTTYHDDYEPSVKQLRSGYDAYGEAQRKWRASFENMPHTQDLAWKEYVDELARHGWNPNNVPFVGYRGVINGLHSRGVMVPNNWSTHDKPTFYNAIAEKTTKEATSGLTNGIVNAVGERIPLNLSWPEFVAQPAIQKKWKEALNLDVGTISASLTRDTWNKDVYRGLVERKANKLKQDILQDPKAYSEKGSMEKMGRNAVEGAIVPPIALMFSLLGAFTHIFKSSRYLMALLWRPKTDPMAIWELQNRDLSPIMNKAYKQESRRDIFLLAIIAMMAGSVFLLPNSITRDTRFQAMLEKGQISTLDAQASIWVIQAEPYVYPVTNAIRKYILIGFEF